VNEIVRNSLACVRAVRLLQNAATLRLGSAAEYYSWTAAWFR